MFLSCSIRRLSLFPFESLHNLFWSRLKSGTDTEGSAPPLPVKTLNSFGHLDFSTTDSVTPQTSTSTLPAMTLKPVRVQGPSGEYITADAAKSAASASSPALPSADYISNDSLSSASTGTLRPQQPPANQAGQRKSLIPDDYSAQDTLAKMREQSRLAAQQATLLRTEISAPAGGFTASWNCMDLDRTQALKAFNEQGPVGTFIIRSSDKTYAALSVVGPSGPLHLHIEQTPSGKCCLRFIERVSVSQSCSSCVFLCFFLAIS
eukprot:m.744282 g.744282  ORF g.744282 m.744282 type:complete len:263 (-) comp58951_c0_seq1:44-832(-)